MSSNIYKYLQQQGIPLYEAIKIIQEILANFSQLTNMEETAFNNKLQTKLQQFSIKAKDFKLFLIFQKY